MRHGSADLHAGAADRRTLRDALLLLPGPGFDETVRLGEDPGGNDRALPREVRRRHHRAEEGGDGAWLSFRGDERGVARKGASAVTKLSRANGFVSTGLAERARNSWVSPSTVSPVAKITVAATCGASCSRRSYSARPDRLGMR